tara:strand:- start:26771 stop:27826 length:1056 start_codon:yes stop_codon:yes gene_type:complete
MRNVTFANSINAALEIAMSIDNKVICYGLGATDPKGIFGTTLGLEEKFGKERVFDMPTSENAMTGVAIGAGIGGYKTVMTHQRLDFFLLAMDQLVNSAAKMHYMFNGELKVPITIRLILGRGWGQGPTHSQNLQSWFAHIPGLKVVMPSSARDAKGLLLSSIFDPNPVLFLEHRWLHNSSSPVEDGDYRIPFGKAKKLSEGDDITIVSMSYLTPEALIAISYLKKYGISVDLIDLRSIKPMDLESIVDSLKKTGKILVLDTGSLTCSVASDIVSKLSTEYFDLFKKAPVVLAMPDVPEPTSYALTKNFYIRAADIANKVLKILGIDNFNPYKDIPEPNPHDVPGEWFKGPF